MKKIYTVLFGLLLIHTPFSAQEYNFEVLSVEDGISQSSVTCIAQDDKGFVWIGTRDGLNHYDGHDIKVFRKIPFDSTSLTSNYIISLLAENSSGLWVGTSDGLQWYDAQTRTFEKINLHTGKALVVPRTIFQDKFGGVWVGTSNGFFSVKRDQEGKQFLTKSYLFNKNFKEQVHLNYRIIAFLHDSRNDFWVLTTRGLFRFPLREDQSLEGEFDSLSLLGNHLVSREMYSSIYEHSDGTILVSSREKILRYDAQSAGFVDFSEQNEKQTSPIFQIAESQNGQLIAATNSGLNFISIENNTVTSSHFVRLPTLGISQNRHKINFILEDNIYDELYWLATDIGGVVKMSRRKKPFQTLFLRDVPNLRIENPYLRHIVADEERIWINLGLGILIYDLKKNTSQFFQDILLDNRKPGNTTISFLFQNQNGKILAGINNAIVEVWADENGHIQTKHHPFQKFCIKTATSGIETAKYFILGDNAGKISILLKEGFTEIACLEPGNFSEIPSNISISSFLMDAQSNLWVGTVKGLIVYPDFKPEEKGSQHPQYFSYNPSDTTSLIENWITHLMQDSKNNIWVCTRNGLMTAKISKQGVHLQHVKAEILQNQVIYGILEDQASGQLWMSTNNGLFCYNPVTGKVNHFNVKDGLQSNEFNTASFFQSQQGKLFFGGPKGVTHFFPNDIRLNEQAPPTWFTELKTIDNKRVDLLTFDKKETLLLDYEQRSFSISFIGLDFFQPEELHYSYELKGTMSTHQAALGNSRMIHFSQLRPGDYSLRIMAANKDGAFSQQGDTLHFSIHAPFWKMMWFYLLITGLVIALFWLTFYLRYRNK